MKKLLLTLITCCAFVANAQASLGEMMKENGIDWILGSWKAEQDGNAVTLSYKWSVEGHVISSHLKMGSNETYALIGINPKSGKVEHLGFNNKGDKTTGEWMPFGDLPMLKVKSINESAEERSMAVAFKKVDDETIELQIYSVDDSGNVASSSDYTFEMKKN